MIAICPGCRKAICLPICLNCRPRMRSGSPRTPWWPSRQRRGGAFKVFIWYGGKWVYTCAFLKDESIIAVLNSAYVYLVKALNGLLRAGANLEDEELLLTLGEITHGVARAKEELSQGVIVPLEKAREEGEQER